MPDPTLDETVAAIARRAVGARVDELDGVLHDALAELGPLLGVDRIYLIAVESPPARVTLANEWCADAAPPALSTVLAMGPLAREQDIRRRLEGLGVMSVVMVPSHPAGSLTGTIFVTTSTRDYRPKASVFSALQAVVDAFVGRLVGIRNDQVALAMRKQLPK